MNDIALDEKKGRAAAASSSALNTSLSQKMPLKKSESLSKIQGQGTKSKLATQSKPSATTQSMLKKPWASVAVPTRPQPLQR